MTVSIDSSLYQHPAGSYVHINGADLWLETEGQGETIVVLPGGPGASHLILHPWFSPLTDRYRLAYYDYIGRGKSSRPQSPSEWTFQRDVEDLEGIREALGVDEMSIYGFSYGGMVAQAYAIAHPERVKKLILANTLHSAEMWHENHMNINREIELQYPELWSEILEMRARGMRSFDPAVRKAFASVQDIIRFYDASNSKKRLVEPNMQNDDAYRVFVGEDFDFLLGGEMAKVDLRPELHKITAPVMILAGRYDRALYPKMQMQFREYLPNAEFHWMEKSGSFSHVEEQDRVLELVDAFMRGERAPEA